MYKPGIIKDRDQSVSTYWADIKLPTNEKRNRHKYYQNKYFTVKYYCYT